MNNWVELRLTRYRSIDVYSAVVAVAFLSLLWWNGNNVLLIDDIGVDGVETSQRKHSTGWAMPWESQQLCIQQHWDRCNGCCCFFRSFVLFSFLFSCFYLIFLRRCIYAIEIALWLFLSDVMEWTSFNLLSIKGQFLLCFLSSSIFLRTTFSRTVHPFRTLFFSFRFVFQRRFFPSFISLNSKCAFPPHTHIPFITNNSDRKKSF